jgi:hypothetical protein
MSTLCQLLSPAPMKTVLKAGLEGPRPDLYEVALAPKLMYELE